MTDLASWLLAQIADDEAAARAVIAENAAWGGSTVIEADALGDLIERWNPARVLAECAAKKAIVELHAVTVKKVPTAPFDAHTGEPQEPEYEVDCAVCGWASDVPTSACPTLRLLAQPYADRPGFDPAWKTH